MCDASVRVCVNTHSKEEEEQAKKNTRTHSVVRVYISRAYQRKKKTVQATESIKEAAEISLWHVNEIAYGA